MITVNRNTQSQLVEIHVTHLWLTAKVQKLVMIKSQVAVSVIIVTCLFPVWSSWKIARKIQIETQFRIGMNIFISGTNH